MESLLLPSQIYSSPTALKNSLGLICVLVKCTVKLTQVREGRNALLFPNKNSFLKKQKKCLKRKINLQGLLQYFQRMATWALVGQNYIFFTGIFQSSCSYCLQKGMQVCFLEISNTQYIKIMICTGFSDTWKPSSMLKGSTTNSSHMRKSTIKQIEEGHGWIIPLQEIWVILRLRK